MFYAHVLTGDYTEAPDPRKQSYEERQRQLISPPAKDTSKNILYDSVVDDEYRPKMYIVFNNDQSYPDYLITYTHNSRSLRYTT